MATTSERTTSEQPALSQQTPANEQPPPGLQANLWQRLAWMRRHIRSIAKTGTSPNLTYPFFEEEEVQRVFREAMDAAGVVLVTEVLEGTVHLGAIPTKTGGSQTLTEVKCRFTWVNVENPDEVQTADWYGQSADSGDKGGAQAISSATKSFLLKALNITEASEPGSSRAQARPESGEGGGSRSGNGQGRSAFGKFMAAMKEIGYENINDIAQIARDLGYQGMLKEMDGERLTEIYKEGALRHTREQEAQQEEQVPPGVDLFGD